MGPSFEGFLMNASGPRCTTREELIALHDAPVCAVVTKSMTLQARAGNLEPRYYSWSTGAVQSMGLPNPGYLYYLEVLKALKKRSSKPTIASVAGFCTSDYLQIIKALVENEADAVELNLSCPNVFGKPIIGYSLPDVSSLLDSVSRLDLHGTFLGLKLPPYFDMKQYESIAEIINNFNSVVSFITCVNSVGNTLVINPDTQSAVTSANFGLGGLSGACIKPIGLANVSTFRRLLGKSKTIIGVGGINSGTDAFEYLLAGATAVQVGECYQKEGTDCFARLNKELSDNLRKRSISNLDEVRGKLKFIS